ncbi:TyeA family type III secretion system gatekeeper subunit [Desulfovibrio sp.]
MFDGNEGRMKVLDAVQDAVDAAIAEEDAWLAEQG